MSDEAIQTALQGERKFTVVPILFVFLRLWGTIRFFIYCISPSASLDTTLNKVLLICHVSIFFKQCFNSYLIFTVGQSSRMMFYYAIIFFFIYLGE